MLLDVLTVHQTNMQIPKLKIVAGLTSRVSQPPTMLRPRPRFPLQISTVHSLPARTGQRRGSEVVSADSKESDPPMWQVCALLKDDEGEKEGLRGDDSGERERGCDRDVGGGREESQLLEQVMESLTAT